MVLDVLLDRLRHSHSLLSYSPFHPTPEGCVVNLGIYIFSPQGGTDCLSAMLDCVQAYEDDSGFIRLEGTDMRRLTFIDDGETELESFRGIVGSEYEYTTIHWPGESAKLFSGPIPDIFVGDLYLPAASGDITPTVAL